MKKGVIFSLIFALFLIGIPTVFAAEACDLKISLLNQDPYPAVPGEEVKLVFQIDGLENSECGTVYFELLENYPITLLPDQNKVYEIKSGTYQRNFESFFLATYRSKISSDALEGDNTIEVKYRYGNAPKDWYITKQFDLNVEDTRANFEIHVRSYDPVTREISFEILNIAEADIEALTVEIPKQENITVKGSNRNIVGDLDSNEYTTAEFEAIAKDGKIKLILHYSDQINQRRTIEEEVYFESDYFEGLVSQQKKSPWGTIIFLLIVVGTIGYFIYRKQKKKKKLRERLAKK